MSDPPPRTRPAAFQPRVTLSLLYLALFFIAYSLLLVAPELAQFEPPADPADDAAALEEVKETIRRAYAPRLPYAFALAAATLFLTAWQGWLPGIHPPNTK